MGIDFDGDQFDFYKPDHHHLAELYGIGVQEIEGSDVDRRDRPLKVLAAAADSGGQAVASWPEVASVWASIVPLTGREFYSSAQVQSEAALAT